MRDGRVLVTETLLRTWYADVASMRADFAPELADDEATTDAEVIESCWDNGVRDPYFLLQDESMEDLTIDPAASA